MKNKRRSIKNKLFQIIMISTIISILASCLVSFTAIYSMEKNQIQKNMRFSLNQMISYLDQGYLNLVNVMQSLEPGGSTGAIVTDFLEEQDNYEKAVKREILAESLSNILFTNLSVREIYYIDPESQEVFCGSGASYANAQEKEEEQALKKVGDHFFFCLEKSDSQYEEAYIVSMLKENQDFGQEIFDIYMEQQIESFGETEYALLQIDEDRRIRYTESEDFHTGEVIEGEWNEEDNYETFQQNGNYVMLSKSRMGFYYALSIPLSVYNKETNMWQMRMIVIVMASLVLFYSIVVVIYHMIGKPIQKLKQEIEETGKGNFGTIEEDTGIEEFNQVIATINRMRTDIKTLQEKEKTDDELRKKAEIEKLMYQINPHFVLNTLYSVQWMAQREGKTQIREFVHNLTAILSYNLGKEKSVSTLRTEIEIARKYIEIQKERYDFEVRLEVEEGSYLDAPTIRMLLQPLIENALQYGLGTSGRLEMWIFEDPMRQYAVIIVRDYGEGLSREKLWEINQPLGITEQKRSGIGLRYVRYMLETFYGGEAILNVNSTLGRGTKISILIPIRTESE